ncbi:SWIM zinc finger family protein [Singulisphaera sp. Ch08]|uniref:SWIM zinc finger family protein n=1 Tax=Singulisphaera sp. Ch08 TaxID=3120278 RepID=A0AAU7CAF9_9BACT
MSDETPSEEKAPSTPSPEPAEPEHVEVNLAYAGASTLVASGATAELTLAGNIRRPPVRFEATLKDPLRFREAMSALYAVVGSDYRYVPKDRTAYVAFLRMRRESASQGLWQAQRAYFSWLLRNDPLAYLILDPVITVHPDQVFFEVFSKDEGAYAKLGIDRDAFDQTAEPTHGTTNIDFSQALFAGLQQMRSYRETRLSLGRDGVKLATAAVGEVLEKQIRVPDSWLRGFLQVQSAAALPMDSFSLAPIDLYNVLCQLRLQADRKGQRRGLRIELVPGEVPRLVMEPWDLVVPSTSGIYKGKSAKVVRVWGRRRLSALRRFLPFVDQIDVSLLGSGLPSFWILRGGGFSLTLGLTGFTAANWSQAVNFDLLLPRKTKSTPVLDAVLAHLEKHWSAGAGELAKSTGLKWPALLEALQLGCQQGKLMYDLAANVYRLRPLTEDPLDLTRLEYRNPRERIAHDLVVRRGAVKIVTENRIPASGLELTGKVVVEEDRREYRPQLLMADEGQVTRADCTCPAFRKQGLKAGPCVHLIALRLAYAEQEAKRLKGGDAKQVVTVETRTYSRRDPNGEEVHQVSLERRRLRIRWGRAGVPPRLQTLTFDTLDEARTAYLARIGELDARGFLDATAG